MRIDKDRLNYLYALQVAATEHQWDYSNGCVKTERDKIIAYICQPEEKPDFQQEADGEFIAGIRNLAPELLEELSRLREVNERLVKRILRLEEKLYDNDER
jgi:hypothetical protein